MSDESDPPNLGAPVEMPAASERPRASSHSGGALVRVHPAQAVVPSECACCGGVAGRSMRAERFFEGAGILVPYCAECHAHASAHATRRLGVAVSSGLLAATLATGLPLLWQPPSLAIYTALVLLGALVPLSGARLWRRRPAPGHAATGSAAVFRLDGGLACASLAWGQRLARASGATFTPTRFRERYASGALAAVVLLAAVATPSLYGFHFPEVRIENASDHPLSILVDGRLATRVEPTSGESPFGGRTVRIPAGRRELTALDPAGHVVDTSTVLVAAGGSHLYAPGSQGTCFWLESAGYGRAAGGSIEPLAPEARFWTLPLGVDVWFSPLPAANPDDRSSGGIVRALRRARCEDAPEGVRAHRSGPLPRPFATHQE